MRLGMDPAERLQFCQIIVLRQRARKIDDLMVAPLWRHDNTPDLLDLRIVNGRYAIHIASNLGS